MELPQKDKDKWEVYKEISRIAVPWCRGVPQKDNGKGRAMKALPYHEPVAKPLEQKERLLRCVEFLPQIFLPARAKSKYGKRFHVVSDLLLA